MNNPTPSEATPQRKTLEARLFDLLGTEWCGSTGAPCDHIGMPGGLGPAAPIVHISEDAFTVWIGTEDEWQLNMSRTEARRLAFWVLFRWWAWGEWFGLRRYLWFKLLNRRVAMYSQSPPLGEERSTEENK